VQGPTECKLVLQSAIPGHSAASRGAAADDLPGRLWSLSGQRIVHDSGLSASREINVSVRVQPDHCLVIIPHMHAAGCEGPFVLRAFCSTALEASQVSPLLQIMSAMKADQSAHSCS
jgi:hypothetical protein